ncbi:MAG: hypothetical protein BWY56_00942 [Acidobacteria bacterium ADurb.Bin340]|nr:MAG: hypothetical protein BWY56_00942 [Acidobacteria bacterium ADurb.Bin340]
MDPATLASVQSLVQALRLGPGQAPEAAAALARLAGQEVNLLLLLKTAEGVTLRMPSGQRVTAQGDLPFPEGTRLQVQVQSTPEGLRLKTLAAQPPEVPGLLAPLVQGEARGLMARVATGEGGEAAEVLRALVALLGRTTEAPSAPMAGSRVLPGTPVSMDLAQALSTLPPAEVATLARALGLPPEVAPIKMAEALAHVLLKPAAPEEAALTGVPRLLSRVAHLMGRPPADLTAQEPLAQVVLRFFGRGSDPAGPPSAPPAASAPEAPPVVAARLAQALAGGAVPPPEVPATWEAWLPSTLKALSDPSVSPREAPFHALQAREGTAFFEVPLPWAPGTPLHLWVEEEPEARAPSPEVPVKRVLLGLRLSVLGETRAGLAWGPRSLAVRLWAEHPEALEAEADALRADLAVEGGSVDLRIFRLEAGPEGIPSLQALVAGRSLEALG